MQKLELSQTYSCPPEQVVALYLSEDNAKARARAGGAIEVEVLQFEKSDDTATIKIKRLVDVELPAFAKNFLPAQNTLIETNQWTQLATTPFHCTYQIEIKKTPVKIAGTIILTATDEGCQQDVTAEITARVPLVGKKLEQFVSENTKKNIEAEFSWLRCQVSAQ